MFHTVWQHQKAHHALDADGFLLIAAAFAPLQSLLYGS
jgi:hypothetical protein